MARILVTGIGGPAGRSVAALLRARGHCVLGVDARDLSPDGVEFSRVALADDPRFLAGLARVAAARGAELLIPTVTEELTVVAAEWDAVSPVPAMIGPAEAVRVANDKLLTCRQLSRAGVAVPRFCLPSEAGSAADVARLLGWPCLSKPRVGRGGRGVVVRYETDWPAMALLDDGYILQEFLPGTDYGPNLFLPRSPGMEATAVVLEKTQLKEGLVGNALEVRRVAASDVLALAVAAARSLGFSGPLDVDIRNGRDGAPAVLEINARFGANIAFAPEVLDAALADWGYGA